MLGRVCPVTDKSLRAADNGVVPLPNNQRLAIDLAGRVERVVEERAILNEDKQSARSQPWYLAYEHTRAPQKDDDKH